MPDKPPDVNETVTLKDGTRVSLRAIRPDDAPRLQAAFHRLSADSVYLRFMQVRGPLTDAEARDLATIDYRTRMAIVATVPADGDEAIIGVARYGLLGPDRPGLPAPVAQAQMAEAAIVVTDDYQKRGLGSLLVPRLARYAVSQGVRAFFLAVHVNNLPILNFIRKSGLRVERRLDGATWEMVVHLPEAGSA